MLPGDFFCVVISAEVSINREKTSPSNAILVFGVKYRN
tara:strand:- start:318 stop:431 length:114 start_codon:yes stop_codon:yes gene_type:complete